MAFALHDGEAPNTHKRPQPVELLPQGLGAHEALDVLEERHVVASVTGDDTCRSTSSGRTARAEAARVAVMAGKTSEEESSQR